MAFVEADRVQIRLYVGASAIFASLWPALENAISASQSVADGGSRPDSSTETLVKSILTTLQQIDAARVNLLTKFHAVKVDELTVDAVRGTAALRQEGRILVGRLCSTLGMRGPVHDVYSSSPPNVRGMSVCGDYFL
jgi:hypothetical protein